ncbi:MAG TPA: hypothetical protein PLM60_08660 [Methanoregulaceae archaeon]|nr:hypothetical protein [Burkholderiaceae bacterium]NLH25003.1 hypothetical protein [Methanomicrobiales archaeon]HNW80085.1 hypothetical protein [Methanoregulaceae archaeon]HPS23460.1 hypothetical protein [Methanoregulaceae archaeon]
MNHDRDGTRKGTEGSLSQGHALIIWHEPPSETQADQMKDARFGVISTADGRRPVKNKR